MFGVTLADIGRGLGWFAGINSLFIAAAMSFVLVVIFGKTREIGRHAIENTSASIVLYVINIAIGLAFSHEIFGFARKVYALLGVPSLPEDFWAGTPVVLTFVLVIVVKDFCDYVIHRLMHTTWGWPSHAAHHSDTHVNAFSAFRVHYLEIVLMQVNYLLLLSWLQLPHLYPALVTLVLAHNMYVHMDLPYTHGPLKYLIASPVFHRWHHADVPEAQGKNLANIMPIYDLIFGTYYVPRPCDVPMGALLGGIEDKNPLRILAYPFTEWARLLRAAVGKPARRIEPGE